LVRPIYNPRVALVGSDSLLGREIRDLAANGEPSLPLRLIADEEKQEGSLTRLGDEPAVVGALEEEALADVRVVILAGSEASSRKALKIAGESPDFAIIDLTYAAEERPDARLRAPLIEAEAEADPGSVNVIAHPAAIALALFLRRLHTNDPIRRSVIQIFVPASEQGQKGVEELQHQTVNLLSFKNLPQTVFDAQAAFTMLAKYGTEAPASLEETELRIERHLATLLALEGEGEGAPMPSLRVAQAPVFHGYIFSAWVEFEGNPGVEAIESSLAMDSIEVLSEEFDPPNNVGQAGQSGIAVGAISPDRNDADAVWFWFAVDNMRLAAENAVMVAGQLA
jgi:aspartate-semialdehyde dehydrogenase